MSTVAEGARFEAALENAERFFLGDAHVQRAMHELARNLESAAIPYAIAGAMALNAYGYERVTKDVDVLLTRDGLARFKERFLGRGYVEKFAGSKGLRDTVNGISIDVLVTGDFPGDRKPKPVSFPDPAQIALQASTTIKLLPLPTLLELKIASGMTAPHRLRDLADVLEVIRARALALDFAEQLNPYVRDKYRELWTAAQAVERDD